MYQTRHTGPPNNPQAPPPAQGQFSGPVAVINESCDRIKKEFDALSAANHSLRMEIEKLHNEKNNAEKHHVMYYEMSYGLHLDVCRQKEIVKRLNNIILNILPIVSNDQQAQIASSVDRAKQVSPEELNSILDQQMREGYAAAEMNPSMAGIPGLGRPLPGTPGLPGIPGLPPHGPPMHLPHNLQPHSIPPHGAPPMHGLPPQALVQPGLNMSSPPNAAGLLAMSGAPGMPGLGAGGLLAGMPGAGLLPPHLMPKDNPPSNRNNNSIPTHLDNNTINNNINNTNNNHPSNSAFNHNKPPRNSIDGERRATSSSSATSDRDRDGHPQSNESKHHSSKKHRRSEDSSHSQQHQVMINNSSSVSDDEKSEDLVVDGNDERTSSPNLGNQNGAASPRENGSGSTDWTPAKSQKRPLSRASSVTSGCGPSSRERSSPKVSGQNKAKSSPSTIPGPMSDPMGALAGGMPPNPMMPGLAGYGRSMYGMGPLGPDGLPMPSIGPGGMKVPMPPGDPYSIQLDSEGRPKFIPCSPRALADPAVPKKAREVFSLDHGEVVCAVSLSNPTRNIYTGGKGFVKVWTLDNSESNNEVRAAKVIHNPVAELACLPADSYVRSCKLLPDGKKLIVGGEVPPISVWDLAGGGNPRKIGQLQELATACYALAISPDSKTCITCFNDGTIGYYDVHNMELIDKFQGHEDGASCIDISSDGNTLWTGGLDHFLKSWNILGYGSKIAVEKDYVSKHKFNSQIFSLGCCPSGDYIAVGMENSIIEVMSTQTKPVPEKMQLKMHDSCVLALKFAASGKWFVSTGKDKLLNLCGSPAINCPQIMKFQENSSVLSCDISGDDKYFATGSGEKKATVYEVLY